MLTRAVNDRIENLWKLLFIPLTAGDGRSGRTTPVHNYEQKIRVNDVGDVYLLVGVVDLESKHGRVSVGGPRV